MDEFRKEQAAVRSFRITDETLIKFKEIQDQLGLTQDGVLKLFISSYEMEQAKNAIPDRETEINNFQVKANELIDAFLYSLQLNQDAEVRIRADYALQLETKDEIIAKYQYSENKLKDELENAKKRTAESEAKVAEIQKEIELILEHLQSAENKAIDKEKLADALTDQLDEYKAKAAKSDGLAAALEEQKAYNEALKAQLSGKDAEILSILAESDKASVEAELKLAQALAEQAAQHSSAIVALKDKASARENELRDKIDSLKDEREQLNTLIAELKAENEQLRFQLIKPNAKQAEPEEPEQMEF